jgi:hypothetical protein
MINHQHFISLDPTLSLLSKIFVIHSVWMLGFHFCHLVIIQLILLFQLLFFQLPLLFLWLIKFFIRLINLFHQIFIQLLLLFSLLIVQFLISSHQILYLFLRLFCLLWFLIFEFSYSLWYLPLPSLFLILLSFKIII